MANATSLRKRIAAVAVAALGAGLLVAGPAQAAVATPFKVTAAEYTSDSAAAAATVTLSQVAGANNFVSFTAVDDLVTPGVNEEVRAVITVTGSTITTFTNSTGATGTLASGATTLTYDDENVFGGGTDASFRVATAAAGTITVKVAKRVLNTSSGVSTDTTLQTFTVTVNASAVKNIPVASKTDIVVEDYEGNPTEDDLLMPAFIRPTENSLWDTYSYFEIETFDANSVATDKDVTATISGPGNLEARDSAWSVGKTVVSAIDNGYFGDDLHHIYLYSDGSAGVSTITFTAGGVTVATWKVTFYGKTASLTGTIKAPHVVDSASTEFAVVAAKDSSGRTNDLETFSATSSATTVIPNANISVGSYDSAKGGYPVTVTPVDGKSGSVDIKLTSSNDVVTTITVVVTDELVADVAWAFDKAVYAPGEKATVTITVKDKNGLLLGKKTNVALFGATLTTSTAITSTLASGGTVSVAAGKATMTFFMPLGTGDFTISGTLGADVTTPLVAATPVSISAKVVNAELDAVKAETAKAIAAVAAVQTSITAIQTAISTLVASFTSTLTLLQSKINRIMKKLGIK